MRTTVTDAAEQSEAIDTVRAVLNTLTRREREIITLRYGIGDGYTYTLEEVGRVFNVTRERVRQIAANAIRKLQRPGHANRLANALAEIQDDEPALTPSLEAAIFIHGRATQLCGIAAIANAAGVSPATVEAWIHNGLPVMRTGTERKMAVGIARANLIDWLEDRAVNVTKPQYALGFKRAIARLTSPVRSLLSDNDDPLR
jgi:hypothetical protein